MSDTDDPFRVDDEGAGERDALRRRREALPAEQGAAGTAPDEAGEPAGASPRPSRSTTGAKVDARTVAERRGTAVEVVAGRREKPAGWPLEALAFPLRAPGPVTIVGGAVVWALLDGICLAGGIAFAGYLLKLLVLPLFLRWQVHVAAMSAGGWDRPAGWQAAMDMDREQVGRILRLLALAGVLLVPGVVADALDRPLLALALFALGSLGLATGALGAAVGDPRLVRPWHGAIWLARHPLGLAVSTLGWWSAGLLEILLISLRGASVPVALAACLGARLAFLHLWLLSARALGVVGRSWSPFATSRGG